MLKEIKQMGEEKLNANRRIIIFVGPEGSGKSTQGKLLANDLGTPYISTGDIIRDKAKNDNGPLGIACRKMEKENSYLNPNLIRKLLVDRLLQDDTTNGVVIDGGLRTLEETINFDETLNLAGKRDFKVSVIFLNIDEEIGIQRRLESKDKRTGETRETILKRLTKFNTNLDERMNIVKEKYTFYEIDGSKNIDNVHSDLVNILMKHE